jgi:hypothetical protein
MDTDPETGLPVMYCHEAESRLDGTPVWTFFCPHCKRQHVHSTVPGHRRPHCHDPNSPFKDGYVLAREKAQ